VPTACATIRDVPGRSRIPRSTFGVALTLFEVWRRLPPKQRQMMLTAARKHGPRVAAAAWSRRRRKPF